MYSTDQFLHKRPSGTKAELNEFVKATLKDFFETYPLDESLENLWLMIKQSFYTKRFVLTNSERANLIAYYETLHTVILAASIINDELKRPS
ncbi:MAG: hypothetical protein P0Y49_18770 [Candidatus Pedobacter colombiensis]|uniref:Uncharacterized protein n=1 Tax=Candidatus Pedobacter colombiensis TaxID=3121371 RepID=A0AAJ5W9J0_9SPHI|nr:hypothetical protein [Pedobacter sp.]WEK18822.1 MAG: hypothetical protein P0Y49_18770 [Pedobacter sp.]